MSSNFSNLNIDTLVVNNEGRYYHLVIVSFADPETQALAEGIPVSTFSTFERVGRRKLRQLEIAGSLEDLRIPPDNRLEIHKGDREGQSCIRINSEWCIYFNWTQSGAREVKISKYIQAREETDMVIRVDKRVSASRTASRKSTARRPEPITPGELLWEEFMDPMGISAYRLAKEIEVPAQRIGEIIKGKRSISADTDLRLCRFFGLSNGYWLRAQAAHDIKVTQVGLEKSLKRIKPWSESKVVQR
jgi:addiction module HigA family antidote